MKSFLSFLILIVVFTACDKEPYRTDDYISYPIGPYKSKSEIYGEATIYKLSDNSIELKIELENTDPDLIYIGHVHNGDTANLGPMTIYLDYIFGDDPLFLRRITRLDDNTPMTFDDWLNYEGYIAIHLRNYQQRFPIYAAGNIGSSAYKHPTMSK